MRQALVHRARRGSAVSRLGRLPPPTGGWNARDALSAMPADDAVALVNWIPELGRIRQRPPSAAWATGIPGVYIETLMTYSPPSGTEKLFAAANTAIYDVTSNGAVGGAVVSSLNNARWQHTLFTTSSGTTYLVAVNGNDGIHAYDGSTWSAPTPTGTGLTLANLVAVNVHMARLWYIEKDSLRVWYGETGAISGTLTKFDLAPLCKRGGYLVAMGSWTHDGGSGPDDFGVFITSNGEVLVYAGTDPGSAVTWGFHGLYKIAPPIGRRCLMKVGGDLGVLTQAGFLTLSQVVRVNEAGGEALSTTAKIGNAFRDAFRVAGTNFGWQVIEYPKSGLAILNVPLGERSVQEQYVLNTATGAWCRFTDMNAGCWGLKGGTLYYGGNDSTVYQYDVSTGTPPKGLVQTGFTAFGSPSYKHFKMVRPLFNGPIDYIPSVAVLVDYDLSPPMLTPLAYADPSPAWDVPYWDTVFWGVASVPSLHWQGAGIMGSCCSVAFATASAIPLEFNGADVLHEPGGAM